MRKIESVLRLSPEECISWKMKIFSRDEGISCLLCLDLLINWERYRNWESCNFEILKNRKFQF